VSPLQHSPGPWTFDGESVWGADNCYVCSKVTPGNARLIAAAPDMLRMLRVLSEKSESGADTKDEWYVWRDAMHESKALIARLDGGE